MTGALGLVTSTLMNDPAYVEMALALANRMAGDHSEMTISQKIAYGFRLCTSRKPSDDELKQLAGFFDNELTRFEQNPALAETLVESAWRGGSKVTEMAAWFFVANVLLNLDESITKG